MSELRTAPCPKCNALNTSHEELATCRVCGHEFSPRQSNISEGLNALPKRQADMTIDYTNEAVDWLDNNASQFPEDGYESLASLLQRVANEAMAEQKERDAKIVSEYYECACSPEYVRLAPRRDPNCRYHEMADDLSEAIRKGES